METEREIDQNEQTDRVAQTLPFCKFIATTVAILTASLPIRTSSCVLKMNESVGTTLDKINDKLILLIAHQFSWIRIVEE